ncbi:MAG: hypothetical protein LBP85_06465 [Prevotellaceae bacterium]|nr:hypothetical protein [Prevotellaceae bacterium]
MKRFIFTITVLMVALTAIFTSCSKDDEVNAPDSIVGTSWFNDTETAIVDGVEVGVGIELDFTSATKGDLNILVGGAADNTIVILGFTAGEFSYTYSKPNVKITMGGESQNGKIAGNKLTIDDVVFEKE